jgi:hypothetical protein
MTEYSEIGEHFARDFATASMAVRREDGLFRHIDWSAPRTMSRLTVITWPHNLLVAGSHGSYHFERWGDDGEMFHLFRGRDPLKNLNAWSNRLANGWDSVREYDQSRLVQQVKDEVADAVKHGAPRGLRAAVREQILESDRLHSQDWAMQLVYDFEHGTTYRTECSCGASKDHGSRHDATMWGIYNGHTRDGHTVSDREIGGFTFTDIGDWSIHKLNYHFVYQCHALVWAVGQYDTARKPAGVAA